MNSSPTSVRGRVFDIQRFSIHDGPGIRTTVFMKGCPLACTWCHNPEGISGRPELSFTPDRCIACGECVRVCPAEAHRVIDGRHVLDRSRCRVCGACAEACYADALELVGRDMTAGEALAVVLRDRAFYETSGGGMTLSGGEPASQIDFSVALLAAAKAEGLHCVVETSGECDYSQLARMSPHVDLFLYDWKESDPLRHQEVTGVSNRRIEANLRRLHADGARIRLRCPIIPGLNDRPEHFAGIASLVRGLDGLDGVEIMPYHRLGIGKMARFGLDPTGLAEIETPSQEQQASWIKAMIDLGIPIRL
jgi:pyruvate formate lyase activating enzyme